MQIDMEIVAGRLNHHRPTPSREVLERLLKEVTTRDLYQETCDHRGYDPLNKERPTYPFRCAHEGCTQQWISNMEQHTAAEMSVKRVGGWILHRGYSLGGKLRLSVFCPLHSGVLPPPEDDGVARGYDAECHTCSTRCSEDWYDEGPFSEDDVRTWMEQHQCEPWTEIIEPKE